MSRRSIIIAVKPGIFRSLLDHFFKGRRLVDISGALVTQYVSARQAEGASNATINRELAVLGRVLRLAYEHGKLFRLPVIHKPKEAGPRQGFFEKEAFQAVVARLYRRHPGRRERRVHIWLAHTKRSAQARAAPARS
jgi:hypothetical protein